MSYIPLRSIREILESIYEGIEKLGFLTSIRGTVGEIRTSITGGSVAISSGTVTTVTTVTTMANQTSIGNVPANPQIPAIMNNVAIQSNISNITIS